VTAAVEPVTVNAGDPVPGVEGYRFTLTCPRCGGPVTHVASGTPGLDTRAVARCEPCRRYWGVVVTVCDVTRDIGRSRTVADHPHGTPSRYARGCHCPECRQAAADRQRDYRRRQAGAA